MKKKILAISLVVSLVAVAALGVTLAYFTDTKSVNNVFTMGNVAIELAEPSWAADTQFTGATAQQPTDGWGKTIATPLLPGDTAPKDPQVKNTGSNAAYVRLKVTISNYLGFQSASDLYQGDDIDIIGDVVKGLNVSNWVSAGAPVVDTVNNTATYTFNYDGILAAGSTTPALFTGIALPSELDQNVLAPIQNGFTITVKAEAIQTENFANATAAFTALDA